MRNIIFDEKLITFIITIIILVIIFIITIFKKAKVKISKNGVEFDAKEKTPINHTTQIITENPQEILKVHLEKLYTTIQKELFELKHEIEKGNINVQKQTEQINDLIIKINSLMNIFKRDQIDILQALIEDIINSFKYTLTKELLDLIDALGQNYLKIDLIKNKNVFETKLNNITNKFLQKIQMLKITQNNVLFLKEAQILITKYFNINDLIYNIQAESTDEVKNKIKIFISTKIVALKDELLSKLQQ